jgi:phosphate transport system substrate-binding protein
LLVPVISIVTVILIAKYQIYVHEIPTLEQDIYLGSYIPFSNNKLVKLDEESNLKLTDNLPVLDGATALYPVYSSFVQAVYPEGNYSVYNYELKGHPVLCSTTNSAYDNLFDGKVDIIFCAQPSEMQLNRFIENGIKLNFTAIGREAFVYFINTQNPINNLSIEDVQGIYSDKIKNWRQLNGFHKRIRAFQRPINSGSQTMLEKIMGNIPIKKPRRENVSRGMGTIINQVAVYRNFTNSIGYSFLFFATEMAKNDQVKLLSINGIHPTGETIQNSSYPFSENFYAIYVESDKKNDNIELFIEWILSEQGQMLIQKTGYVPINN